jgi:hypothetical protein
MKKRVVVVLLVLAIAVGGLALWWTLPSLASEIEGRGGKVVVESETPEGRTVSVVFTARRMRDEDLSCLRGRTGIQRLFLDATDVVGPGLEYLNGCDDLRWVCLGACRVTDDGLKSLPTLPRLELLNLNSTLVTDAGLAHVARQESLAHLHICRTAITDAGLEHLKGLGQLEELMATGTHVTEEGVRRLQKAIPRLTKVQIGKEQD